MDWKDELKLEAEQRRRSHEKYITEYNIVESFWKLLCLERSKLDNSIIPRIEASAIYMSDPSTSIAIVSHGSWIERIENYSSGYTTRKSLMNRVKTYTISIVRENDIGLVISNENNGHIIRPGDEEIILRNHLMNYQTFTDLEIDIQYDQTNYTWMHINDINDIKQSKVDRYNKIFGTSYKI